MAARLKLAHRQGLLPIVLPPPPGPPPPHHGGPLLFGSLFNHPSIASHHPHPLPSHHGFLNSNLINCNNESRSSPPHLTLH